MGQSQSTEIQTGSTELLRQILNKKWDDAVKRSKSHPEEVNTWYQEKTLGGSRIPLQFCMETATEGSSDSSKIRTGPASNLGVMVRLLPLHLACEGNAPMDLIRALIHTFPDAVKVRDHRNHWLPLHYCATSSTENSDAERFNYILGEYPAAASAQEALGRLPLHLACEYGACSDVIASLVTAHPDSVSSLFGSLAGTFLQTHGY